MTLRMLAGVLLIALGAGCASSGGGRASSYDRTQLSRAELAQHPTSNLYDIVSNLRPTWLRSSAGAIGRAATTAPLVYVDGRPAGDAEALRSISPQSIELVRYLSASEAQGKFSMNEARPVLELRTRRPSS